MNANSALNTALRDRRDYFNSKFERAKHSMPRLSAEPFLDLLGEYLSPLVESVAQEAPNRVASVVAAGYDVALALVGSGVWPNSEKVPLLKHAFAVSLKAFRVPIAQAPQMLLPKLLNAVLNGNLDTLTWLARMESMSAALQSPQQVLDAGVIAAWRCGIAHYRSGALELLDRIPTPALQSLFASNTEVEPLKANLRRHRWYRPHLEIAADEIASRVGAFVGLGGLFQAPPLLRTDGAEILVASGERCWVLDADAFGYSLHAVTDAEFQRLPNASALPDGMPAKWRYGPRNVALTQWGAVTSCVLTGHTIALTHARSHSITLIANRST